MEEQKEGQSVFVEYFGDYPLVRVLDFLIDGRDMDYSMTEIAKNSGVGWTAFSEIWTKLVQKEIVMLTRKIGNAKLFKLNLKNPWVKELIRMDSIITKLETDKFLSQEMIVRDKCK
ncbi:MAG TPA: hypothetical protein VJH95_03755 [Candidatus Nanoarchaeia archaeon]|nr:hypothetical protein [Candidatus Nanoarchaeia archaeon]